MRLQRLVLYFLVMFCLTGSAGAQQSVQQDPQAVQLLTSALATMGGTNAATQVQDSVVQGTESSSLANVLVNTTVIKTKGTDKIRWDVNSGGPSTSVISNQGRSMSNTGKGWQTGPSQNAIHQRPTHLPVLVLAYELARPDCAATYIGSEILQGRSVQHVELSRVSNSGKSDLDAKLTNDSKIEVYIDAQTQTVSKISYILLSDTDWRRGLPFEIDYSNYQFLSGIMVPLTQKFFFNGSLDSEFDITSVSLNAGLLDTDFEAK